MTEKKQWSSKHGLDKCQECGTSERKHYARGKCEACFRRTYNRRWIRGYRERQKVEA